MVLISVSDPLSLLADNTEVIWYTLRIFKCTRQRMYMSVGSFIDALCSSKFVFLS